MHPQYAAGGAKHDPSRSTLPRHLLCASPARGRQDGPRGVPVVQRRAGYAASAAELLGVADLVGGCFDKRAPQEALTVTRWPCGSGRHAAPERRRTRQGRQVRCWRLAGVPADAPKPPVSEAGRRTDQHHHDGDPRQRLSHRTRQDMRSWSVLLAVGRRPNRRQAPSRPRGEAPEG